MMEKLKKNKYIILFSLVLISLCLFSMRFVFYECDYFWHIKAGEYAKGRTDELWCLGELTKQTCAAFGQGAKHFDSHEDLIKEACELAQSDLHACFLVKGSHAMHMDLVNQALIKLGEKQ